MKFIIYWALYTSSLGDAKNAGTISITDSTLTSYVLTCGYVIWDIKEKKEILSDKNRLYYGHYYLERNNINSYVVITRTSVYQYIASEPPIHIKLTRKDEYKNRR